MEINDFESGENGGVLPASLASHNLLMFGLLQTPSFRREAGVLSLLPP